MLNFQNLLVHIIGLVIYCYPKNHIQVVYLFSSSNFQTKTNYKCSDENYFSLLFQFSNGKFLGIMYAIFAKQMKIWFINCTFSHEFWKKIQNLMKEMGINTKVTLKHIVIGYKIDDQNYLAFNFLVNSCRILHPPIKPHRWCNGQRDLLECGRSWVRAPIGSTQRL